MTKRDPHPVLGPNRPRTPKIIHRPDLTPPVRRGILGLIAVIGWALWFYLLAPLSALLAWMFGYGQTQTYLLDDPIRTLATMKIYGLVIAAAGLIFLSWAIYNWLRFGGMDRRKPPKTAGVEDMAEDMAIQPTQVIQARDAKNMTFCYDEEGNITGITTNSPHASKTDTPSDSDCPAFTPPRGAHTPPAD